MQKCLICTKETTSFQDTQFNIKYHYCSYCQFIHSKEKKLGKEDEKKEYLRHNNNFQSLGYVNMFKDLLDILDNLKINIDNTLDYGAGPGPDYVLSSLIKKRGVKKSYIYDPFFAPDIKLDKESYNLITATEVFEHFFQANKEIIKLNKLLIKEGFLVIMTLFHPIKELNDNNINLFNKWWYRRDPSHLSFYNENTFNVISKIYGFKKFYCDKKRLVILQKC